MAIYPQITQITQITDLGRLTESPFRIICAFCVM